jgi:hypothetical protein
MSNRWTEISFIEDTKILYNTKSLNEYYSRANKGLFEFLNPDLAYPYVEENMSKGQKMWVVEKQNNDPQFMVTLKNNTSNDYFVLDFYFYETGFDKQQGLEGEHYLDTLCKIIKEEIIPYFLNSKKSLIYFSAYSKDGGGETRKKVFTKIVSKFFDKNKFDIDIQGTEFLINKK